jgi:hypothetical protein
MPERVWYDLYWRIALGYIAARGAAARADRAVGI